MADLDETPIRVTMTEEMRDVIVRAITAERDRARRRAGRVTKELPGANCYEITDRHLTYALEQMGDDEATLPAYIWNSVSWALGERSRVSDYWHRLSQDKRSFLINGIDDALRDGETELDLRGET